MSRTGALIARHRRSAAPLDHEAGQLRFGREAHLLGDTGLGAAIGSSYHAFGGQRVTSAIA